jgi:hypothetical protein
MHEKHELRRPRQDSRHERCFVAVHEAGHVVMSFQVELGVQEVSIVPVGDCLGVCRNDGSLEWQELLAEAAGANREKQKRRRQLLFKHLQVSLAGPEAERLVRGEYNPEGAAGDTETVQTLIDLLGCRDDPAFLDWLRARTARYLARPRVWYVVEAVALGLLRQGRMTGEQARRLYARAGEKAARLAQVDRMPSNSQLLSNGISVSNPFRRDEE